MPKVWENMVKKLGKDKGIKNPYALATSILQKKGVLKPGTRELKPKSGTARMKVKKLKGVGPPEGR